MRVHLDIESLTPAAKLELMERLWHSLARDPASIPTPLSHAEVLNERRHRAESGEEIFHDLSVVKEQLRARTARGT